MKYMFLIYGIEPATPPSPEAIQAEMNSYWAFTKEVTDRGIMGASEALHPTQSATTVRVREGKTLSTDGPFAETHEQLGGFYILDCKDLDEAIELAAKIPGALDGCVEIRPVVIFE
jgi:hypothetical protein